MLSRVATALTLCALALLVVACAGGVNQPAGPGPKIADKEEGPKVKEYTRSEIDKAIMGKTSKEVIAALGKPTDSKRGLTPVDAGDAKFDGSFRYNQTALVVKDPTSGKPSWFILVWFENDRVRKIEY